MLKGTIDVIIDTSKIFTMPKNWLPKLVGVASGALAFFQAYMIHDWHAVIKDPTTMCLFIVSVHGFVTKQVNVTGGDSGQPSTPEALHAANQAVSTVNPPVEAAK